MFWICEYPKIISRNYINLPILYEPIYWIKGIINRWIQYSLYLLQANKYSDAYIKEFLTTRLIINKNNEYLRITHSKMINNPKIIVLYLHSAFGDCYSNCYLAEYLSKDNIVYFSYSRSGVHKDLYTNNFNLLGSMDDLEEVLNYIEYYYPNIPIHVIGESAGACVIIKYLATKNKYKRIKSSVLISPGYNFEKSVYKMPNIVRVLLLSKLKKMFSHCINIDLANSNTLFDWMYNQHTISKYDNSNEYLLNHDPCNFIKDINVPSLLISSLDDFCFPGEITESYYNLPYINNNISMVITNYGGHISFIDNIKEIPWASRVAIQYFKKIANQK